MTSGRVAEAAGMLMAVRQGGAPIAGLGAAMPQSEAEVWAVQQEVLRRLGGRIGGWKCAAPPGAPHTAAMLDAAGVQRGPLRWRVPAQGATPGRIGIETEIAFRVGRDLPDRGRPYGREEVLEAMEACFPAIELVASRYADMAKITVAENMADSIAHAGLVLGADVPGWRGMDLAGLVVRQTHAGAVQVEKPGGNPAGDPVVSLLWLANHLHGFGMMLAAGQVVTTGSCTGLTFVGPGRVTGGFAGFGEVALDLA